MSGNVKQLIEILQIVEEYTDKISYPFVCAEHDEIFLPLNKKIVSPTSKDGRKLIRLGAFYDINNDCWIVNI